MPNKENIMKINIVVIILFCLIGVPRNVLALPDCYHTVEETFAIAESIESRNPNLASWIDIGDSWSGKYDIMVLVLTNKSVTQDKPKVLITSGLHGSEMPSVELALRLAQYLIKNHSTNPDTLNNNEVHLVLQSNPDGRKKSEQGYLWRKNLNSSCSYDYYDRYYHKGTDINRNFPFKWNCCGGSSSDPCHKRYHGTGPNSEPETKALVNYKKRLFEDRRGPNDNDAAPLDTAGIHIDLHSYGKLVIWPWAHTSQPAPNATQLEKLGRKLAEFNGYTPMQSNHWFKSDGTNREDTYGTYGVASYTVELGTQLIHNCDYLEDTIIAKNLPMLLYAISVAKAPYKLDCPYPVDHWDYCKECGPCEENQGDCDSDGECAQGLSCDFMTGVDYCRSFECDLPIDHWDYCRDCGPCAAGQGDCDSDSECGSGLNCVFVPGVDSCCPHPIGHFDYCRDCGPCSEGQGDCDSDSECEGDLTCDFVPGVDACK